MSGNSNVTTKSGYTPRLLAKYRNEVVPAVMKTFGFKNSLQVPKITKVVVNMGVGEGAQDIKVLEQASKEMAIITGQRPIITRAKKAISNFKIRRSDPIGCKVTLRGYRMYEFLDRLMNVAIPRIRDFRGVNPNSFDEMGNYSIGIAEQVIFPEIEFDKIQKITGMGIVITTSATDNKQAYELLKLMGMPFKRS